MTIDSIAGAFAADGWNNPSPGKYEGIAFDLIASRRYGVRNWKLLVKIVPRLDQPIAQHWRQNFDTLCEQAKGAIVGLGFLLCLVADEVGPETVASLPSCSLSLADALKLRGGGGNILILDRKTGMVHGSTPRFPVDVNKFSTDAIRVLQGLENHTTPPPPIPDPAPTVEPDEGEIAICHACGEALADEARFCGNCGAQQTTAAPST